MKTCFFATAFCAALLTVSCGGILSGNEAFYVLELPELPPAWKSAMGEASWRIQWFDGDGRKRTATLSGNDRAEVVLPGAFANPVVALPFWPKKGIAPGTFRPAGAIFPFDVSGGRLVLSWHGGVDATFFLELIQAANEIFAEGEGAASNQAALRLPWNFDWPRFRRLFSDASLNAEIRADPWLANWRGIADRTMRSGFDRRRIVPEARSALELPLGSGFWIGTSPFAAPLFFEGKPVFPVRPAADTWVSADGALRASAEAWIWVEF